MNIGKANPPSFVINFDPKKRVMRCGFSIKQSLHHGPKFMKKGSCFFEKNIATSGENRGVLSRISCGDKLMSKNVEKKTKLNIYLVIWLLDFKFLEIHQGKWES